MLDTSIIKEMFCITFGYNFTTCHYRLTIFTTVPKEVDESV